MEGGRVGAAGHDTTKRRDVSRAPRYRPQPRDTVVVVVVVVLLLILAGVRLEPRDQRPPTDRPIDRPTAEERSTEEEKGGFSIGFRSLARSSIEARDEERRAARCVHACRSHASPSPSGSSRRRVKVVPAPCVRA